MQPLLSSSSISLPSTEESSRFTLKGIWRSWNRLSRFQRSILYVIGVFLLLIGASYLSNALSSSPPLSSEALDTSSSGRLSSREQEKAGNKVQRVKEFLDHNDYEAEKEDQSSLPESPSEELSLFHGPSNPRQTSVVKAFKHAWKGYKTYAWGEDHLKPISKTSMNWFGLGLTIIDGLDTMILMKLGDEFNESLNWIKNNLDFNISKDVNLFETTIRILGGLLSAFHLTDKKHSVLLEKATDLGNRLLGGFKTPSGIPYSDINLKSAKGHVPRWSPDSSTSEVTTLQLEFRDLSRCTRDPQYEEKAFQVSQKVHESKKWHGLVPIFINAQTGEFQKSSTITLGARGDSYYEYLLKQWIQTGKSIDFLKEDYIEAMDGVRTWLTKRTAINNYLFVGEIQWGGSNFKPKMDELVCFLPGTLALGVHHGMPAVHMEMAKALMETCYMTFASNPTHLAPEITFFNYKSGSKKDFYVKNLDAHYLLRPETIESLWYMYYMTKDPTYQDWGWEIFQGIEKYTKYPNGYSNIGNVRSSLNTQPRDLMETYFLAETLKYFYLLFSDRNDLDLRSWVFNTEGHPLPIYDS